ncbi:hypothetical protein T05_12495 [Trichinella murrelli]|uniref:Uncharacterized protein n=1 Tax=Trichinella murrelli TaxID=144512 RepID=A0A0V0TQT1_9BILA|nr:hypothetical protein T05_12495 [Trichinella murrelli]
MLINTGLKFGSINRLKLIDKCEMENYLKLADDDALPIFQHSIGCNLNLNGNGEIKLIAKSTSTSIVCVCFLFTSTDVEHRQLAQCVQATQDHGSRRLKHHRQFENTVTVCVLQILRCSSICTVEVFGLRKQA